ncbi:pleckstrin homology domain-containing family G member 5 isoform X2 [Tribolium castaneum]|uniref:pleckstrin homology domain-containing family G member 5 isoform X2 n=1 Tax=Tribolium castaneum TaxID=7070 RepID=UPI00077DEE6D|nr:PREDICTED: pleckstrin homology domain-containing family G member 5 isoform X2 [Tribolium castaneum]|eukprot:XP_015835650.1 PREDICTED: pleckstrin homology domain-containing family G member 5 isoform X2 [Tribolium castaneum]
MVSEETSMIDGGIYPSCCPADKLWLSDDNNAIKRDSSVESASDVESFVRELIREICERVCEVMPRDRQILADERSLRKNHRRISIVDDELVSSQLKPALNLVDENDNSVCEAVNPEIDRKPKRKKKLSFSFLRKVSRDSEDHHEETYDQFDPHAKIATLRKSKKYSSAVELNQNKGTKLTRTTSLLKKLGQESKNFLKRSVSVRELTRRSRERLISEEKESEWKQSLQSLVETDVSVSYNDLSYVDYDALNNIQYDYLPDKANIGRTQSMYEKRSPEFRRPHYFRGISSTSEILQENSCLAERSGALSLPSLHHLNQENGETTSSPAHRYRRRPQSISSEDGRYRPQSSEGSFRSAGSGCAKLKRQNACRQKNRDVLIQESRRTEQTVRSRSLNHLDTLEMRQGVVSTTDPALKDSRSEPDCTRPLLAPPSVTPEPVTPTRETPPARKHMLSRSQKSSSECFSVNFEVGDEATWDNELFFIAQHGISLHEALAKMCDLRNIDLSQCEARLLDKETNTESFVSFTLDTGHLVGRHIRIIAKETSNKKGTGAFYGNHSRKQSGSYRPRTNTFFSSSTEEPSAVASSTLSLHDGDQSKKQIKQRLHAFFGNSKDNKYEALIEQLDKYSKQGIPNNVSYPTGQCPSVDALHNLEDDWREIVDCSELNEKQQQQQTALWELITSEVSYIRTLKVVTDLFLACLRDLQSHKLLIEIDREKLFSNITEILDANVMFWRNTLFPLIRDMRQHKRTTCIENMAEGFSKIHETFQPYYKYCAEQSRCQHYCRENMDSEVFTAYLTWCESQKECNRLRLMDILVQPMQRLTKYGLLLKAILKNTDEDVERESLQTMIKIVDDFVINVNASLKHKQDKERLKGIIARIESYDIVDTKDDDIDKILKKEKIYTHLDLTRPMLNCHPERKRHLLLEGDLKLKDTGASKLEVHCFLLTDMLLICKPSTKKGGATMRVVRQPYLVDRLVVSELQRETPSLAIIYKNEFDMAVAAFILQNNDAKKIKGWKDGIAKAQALYAQAKQMTFIPDEQSLDVDYGLECNLESDYHSLQLAPRSPLATSSRASRVSSLAHSHSGSVEMNDQSSVGSPKEASRGVSIETENRTGSISSDEGVQPLPPDKSPVSQKNSFKRNLFSKTPNTLSVQPFGSLGQSLPNLTLGSPNVGSMSLSLNQNTLSVPNNKNGGHLLSPTHRGISYPPPSPTRGNLRRGLAISQSKNPPLIKTRHVNSTASTSQIPASFDFDVPVIAEEEHCEPT